MSSLLAEPPGNVWISEPAGLLRETENAPAARTPRVWSMSIVHLGNRALRMPLIVRVEDFGEEVIAAWGEVEAYGSGATEAEAINELKTSISELYEELNAIDDAELGPLPTRWKAALNFIVAP
jgi:hypothetical protein